MILCFFPIIKKKFYAILKVTFYFQLLQNIGFFLMLYNTSLSLSLSSLYLLLSHTYIAFPSRWYPPVCSLYLWICFFLVLFTWLLYFLDFAYKWYHTAFVFFWFILLNIMSFKSIHVAANDKIFFDSWLVFHCMYVPHPLYPFILETLRLLSNLDSCN